MSIIDRQPGQVNQRIVNLCIVNQRIVDWRRVNLHIVKKKADSLPFPAAVSLLLFPLNVLHLLHKYTFRKIVPDPYTIKKSVLHIQNMYIHPLPEAAKLSAVSITGSGYNRCAQCLRLRDNRKLCTSSLQDARRWSGSHRDLHST